MCPVLRRLTRGFFQRRTRLVSGAPRGSPNEKPRGGTDGRSVRPTRRSRRTAERRPGESSGDPPATRSHNQTHTLPPRFERRHQGHLRGRPHGAAARAGGGRGDCDSIFSSNRVSRRWARLLVRPRSEQPSAPRISLQSSERERGVRGVGSQFPASLHAP